MLTVVGLTTLYNIHRISANKQIWSPFFYSLRLWLFGGIPVVPERGTLLTLFPCTGPNTCLPVATIHSRSCLSSHWEYDRRSMFQYIRRCSWSRWRWAGDFLFYLWIRLSHVLRELWIIKNAQRGLSSWRYIFALVCWHQFKAYVCQCHPPKWRRSPERTCYTHSLRWFWCLYWYLFPNIESYNTPCLNTVRISWSPCDLNRMNIGIARDQANDRKIYPLRSGAIKRIKRNQEGKSPQLEHNCGRNATVDSLTNEGHKYKQQHPAYRRRYRQKVCLYCCEAKMTERKCKVSLRWNDRHCG